MEPVLACPACGQPARSENRFCRFCAAPLRKSCPTCGQETTVWARFCPNCRYAFVLPGTQQEEREQRQVIVGLGLPEGAQTPNVPGVSAAPQTGAPTVPTAPAGPQSGSPPVSTAPAPPQTGAPTMPTAPAPPQSGAPPVQGAPAPPPQPGMPGVFGGHPGYQTGMTARGVGTGTARRLGSRLVSTSAGKVIAAVVAAIIVVTSGTAIAAATGHNPLSLILRGNSTTGSSVAPPPVPEVTYIGSDDNIWEMTLPGGTPKQLTTDAQPGTLIYSGMAWSPDGKQLAVVRDQRGGSNELRLLTPDGKVLWQQSETISNSLAWSLDGRFIAYRGGGQCDQTTGYCSASIVVVDARTGSTVKMIPYDTGFGQACGSLATGLAPPLYMVINYAHAAAYGIDTFAWSPDGQEILVAYGCYGAESHAIALSNGSIASGYPAGASFQPGGHLLLGTKEVGPGSGAQLELTDLTGKQVRVLASSADQSTLYADALGLGTWSSDGKTIYYEYQDSIWRVNVDGSGAKQVIAGTPISSNNQGTAEVEPRLSPDGKWLLYLQASGDTVDFNGPSTEQWYVAQADGSGALAVPVRAFDIEFPFAYAVWRPEK